MKTWRIAGVTLTFLGLLCGQTFASWQSDSFLDSIERSGKLYSFEFWTRGLSSVFSVKFDDESTAQFQPFWNKIVLHTSHNDGAERIRQWDRMSSIDLGTLAHESFHAYVHNFIFRESDWRREKEWMKNRAPVVFYEIEKRQAMVAMEEAYASFIGNVVTTARTVEQVVNRNSRATCAQNYQMVQNIWSRTWKDPVQGYYYRDSVLEYWADRARWIGQQMTGEKGEVRFGEPIFTENSISEVDKRWISQNIFEGRWTRDFNSSFPEIVERLEACIAQEEADLISEDQDS